MKILTICPSIYPKKLEKMLESFHATNNCSQILINTEIKPITKILNDTFNKYPDFDYYHISNDDVLYKTKDWDVILANAIIEPGISYGSDGIQDKNLPTFPMISGDIVRSLGWLQMPTLNRYSGDVIWGFIGDQCKCLKYVPEVKIEHKWDGCSDVDMHKFDMNRFVQWLSVSHKDIEKVREVCQKK